MDRGAEERPVGCGCGGKVVGSGSKKCGQWRVGRAGVIAIPDIIYRIFELANATFLVYFVIANVCYTVLMVISLYTVTMQSRAARTREFDALTGSPGKPPGKSRLGG